MKIIHGRTQFGQDLPRYGPRGNKVPHHLGDKPSPEEMAVCLTCTAPVEVCDATDAGNRRGPCPWRAQRLDDDAVMNEAIVTRPRPLEAYKALVDELLESSNWELTATQIYDRLVIDGYEGCMTAVWRYIRPKREGR